MLKKILTAIGGKSATSGSTLHNELYKPYLLEKTDFIYNLLFCDNIDLFRNDTTQSGAGLWSVLLAQVPDRTALRKIADDEANESRMRTLAYNRLRAVGETVPVKKLLGVIVEVPLQRGLDVLAAFHDGGVRYLNQSGKMAFFEGQGNPVAGLASELMSASQPIVEKIGPWDKQRLPPPKPGNIRITFLVSDGLYFGEGPEAILRQDAMMGPVYSRATQLLLRAIELATAKPASPTP